MNTRQPITLIVLFVALALTLACGSIEQTVTITLNEDDINRLIEQAVVTNDNAAPFFEITSVDVQEGFIRVYLTYHQEDGNTVSGSCDLVITVQDGKLKATITAVAIEGFSVGDERITRLNELLTEAFANAAPTDQGQVEFTSVEIGADTLKIGVKFTPVQQN